MPVCDRRRYHRTDAEERSQQQEFSLDRLSCGAYRCADLVNAGPSEFSGFHPTAGIWDKVYPSGNPKNALTAMQNYIVAPGDAAAFDIISAVEGANALVNHLMKAGLSGAIAVLMFGKKADPSMGHGDKILVR